MKIPIKRIVKESMYVSETPIEQVREKIENKSVVGNQMQAIAEDLPGDPAEYEIEEHIKGGQHRDGDGGEREILVFLKRSNQILLASRYFMSYYTYSDDSEDYTNCVINNTFLIEEEGLARLLFEK